LAKTNWTWTSSENFWTVEEVSYVYVEEDVTVSGTGKTNSGTENYDGEIHNWTETTNNFSIALKAGWNAVYKTLTTTYETSTQSTGTRQSTDTRTISLGNPSLRWVLGGLTFL